MLTNFTGYNPDMLLDMLFAFKVLQDDGPMNEVSGVCGNLAAIAADYNLPADGMQDVLCTMFKAWPECYIGKSGTSSTMFPMGGSNEFLQSGSLWEGESGAKRQRFLTWAIEELEQWKNLRDGLPAAGIPLRDVGPFGALLGVQA